MSEKRIDWEERIIEKIFVAYNKEKEHLGYLAYERVGQFMLFCWYQSPDIRMSPGCLQEVRDKQKQLITSTNKKIHRCG